MIRCNTTTRKVRKMVTIKQAAFTTKDGKRIAFVKTEIKSGNYTYPVTFDKETKKRFNAYCKTLGFIIGEVEKEALVPDLTAEVK